MSRGSAEEQRLREALKTYESRTKGGEQRKGLPEALAAVHKVLETATSPHRDTPGAREAHKVVQGTRGTGEPMERAAKGIDGPSPGQRAAVDATRAPLGGRGTPPSEE